MQTLKDKVVVITGSTSGIGKGIAEFFAAQGAHVMVHGLEQAVGHSLVNAFQSRGSKAAYILSDISQPEGCEALINEAVKHFDKLDVLINNAGRNIFTGIEKTRLEDWQLAIDTDLRSAWLCSKAAIPYMPRGSAMINIASNHAFYTMPGCFPYNVAKAGVLALTQSLALELAPKGIRANAICPGYIDTPICDAYFATFPEPTVERQRVERLHPLARIGTPEDIARAARFLALEKEPGFMTGTHLLIDGGRSILMQDPQS